MKPILNKDQMSVLIGNEYKHLTPKEYGILSFLMKHPGMTFTHDEIYREVWEEEPFETKLIIAVHLRHLREKIERNPSKPQWIQSYWGRGYCYKGS